MGNDDVINTLSVHHRKFNFKRKMADLGTTATCEQPESHYEAGRMCRPAADDRLPGSANNDRLIDQSAIIAAGTDFDGITASQVCYFLHNSVFFSKVFKYTVNTVPISGRLSAVILPPSLCMISRQMAKPSPAPGTV